MERMARSAASGPGQSQSGSLAIVESNLAVESFAGRTVYRFPPRRLGRVGQLGWIAIALGVMFFCACAGAGIFWIRPTGDSYWPMFPFRAFFVFIGLLGARPAVRLGAIMLWGRTRVEVAERWIRAVDYAGPFQFRRKRRRENITEIGVESGDGQVYVNDRPSRWFGSLGRLGEAAALCASEKPMILAVGYPLEIVQQFAQDLAARLRVPIKESTRDERDQAPQWWPRTRIH